MLLEGIIAPVTTPFHADGGVYLHKLEYNLDRFSRGNVSGLVILGSTGEAIMLSDEEKKEVLKAARQATADEKVLIAGTGCESAHETLALTEYAASLDHDVALIRTPHYYRTQMAMANVVAFYKYVADRSPIPILLYSIPAFTGYDLPVEAIVELSGHPNIIGIKESGGSIDKVQAIVGGTSTRRQSVMVTEVFNAVTGRMLQSAPSPALVAPGDLRNEPAIVAIQERPPASAQFRTRAKEVGFQILFGSAHNLEAALAVGASGGILAFAVPAPTACYEVYTAWKEGDTALAREKQQRIREAEALLGRLGIPAIKFAMDLNGYYGGPARLPWLPLTGEQRDQVEAAMRDIRH